MELAIGDDESGQEASRALNVLFVCFGNICRSPTAEGIMKNMLKVRGLEHRVTVGSRATSPNNVGAPADPRAVSEARRHAIDLRDHRSGQLKLPDVDDADVIVCMDAQNISSVHEKFGERLGQQLLLLRSFDESASDDLDLADPYLDLDFAGAFATVERSCRPLLQWILDQQLRT